MHSLFGCSSISQSNLANVFYTLFKLCCTKVTEFLAATLKSISAPSSCVALIYENWKPTNQCWRKRNTLYISWILCKWLLAIQFFNPFYDHRSLMPLPRCLGWIYQHQLASIILQQLYFYFYNWILHGIKAFIWWNVLLNTQLNFFIIF